MGTPARTRSSRLRPAKGTASRASTTALQSTKRLVWLRHPLSSTCTVASSSVGQSTVPFWYQSSEARFTNRVKQTFLEEDDQRKIVIAWGDWGRSTNLRNNGPTPG